MYSQVIFVFEMNEEFIVNYKAYITFLEYKKTLNNETVEKEEEREEKEITNVEKENTILN
jgi:hypothetical protein